jgi:hypothetical protein
MTSGINALPIVVKSCIMEKVRAFDAFSPDNHPHHEHDFGSLEEGGHKVFFKVDLYEDPEVKGGDDSP